MLLPLYRKNAKNTSGVSFPESGQMPFSLTSIFSDIPYPYDPDVRRTISSHDRHRVSGMLRLSLPRLHDT